MTVADEARELIGELVIERYAGVHHSTVPQIFQDFCICTCPLSGRNLRTMNLLNLTVGPLAMFAFVASITPGPNNLLLMRSGAAFGVRRSLAHLFGVQVGFIGLLLLAHLGIGAMLLALPGAFTVLRWACFAYLLYLAAMIFLDGRPRSAASDKALPAAGRPMRWAEGVAFQLINPKAWMMAITVATAFYGSSAPTMADLAVAGVVCFFIGGPCMLVWTLWGASIDHVLRNPRARRVYAALMSLAVAATALWMLR
jgi:threonine/homoserine/homoserine lactone efflux protein